MKNNFSSVAIGTFDGVHLGHKKLIERAVLSAKQKGFESIIIALDKPMKSHSGVLSLAHEKIEQISNLLPDKIILLSIDSDIFHQTAEEFLKGFLIKGLNAKEIVCGYDFAFGKDRQGDIKWLKQNAQKYKIDVNLIKPFKVSGNIVSASGIRKFIESSNIEATNEMLGRPFSFSGKQFSDLGLGKELGFPTINLRVEEEKLLPKGVFVAIAQQKTRVYGAVVNLGVRPTLGQNSIFTPEVHLLNFNKTRTFSKTHISLLRYIRPEKKFNSLDELKQQIAKDKKTAERFFQMGAGRAAK
ncbi:MAG: bifunctional riboflavin kinase/FAD synthetase, partial [Elusimicrobiota bacterium]|nr:bifunctional riboflavin kinase/FAD synthetase [Elusimicrobiota bacterium]